MDALIAKADAARPLGKRRKYDHTPSQKTSGPKHDESSDHTYQSIAKHTAVPNSLREAGPLPQNVPRHSHIANKQLRNELTRHSAQTARAQALLEDAEMLLVEDAGKMEVEGEMERTWRVGQNEIVQSAGQEAARGRKELKLDGGPYRSRYTRNGRRVHFI